jgi:hypothetical protein
MASEQEKAEARAKEWLESMPSDRLSIGVANVADLILSVQEEAHARWRNALIPNNEDTDLGRECLNPEFCAGVLKESEKFTLETRLAERDAEVKRVVEEVRSDTAPLPLLPEDVCDEILRRLGLSEGE